jgi:hypothetical protein
LTDVAIPASVRRKLFEAAESSLVADLGAVSIVKFLGGSNEEEACAKWFGAIEKLLSTLPDGVFLGSEIVDGRPALGFLGGVTLAIDLYELQDRRSVADAWRIMARPGLAPVVVDAVADAVWGPRWDRALKDAAGDETYAVTARDGVVAGQWAGSMSAAVSLSAKASGAPAAHGWVVRAAPSEAPWPWFADECRARRAARALALGPARIAALFQRVSAADSEANGSSSRDRGTS